MGEITYVNGELLATADASISVLDRGLLCGDGVFEVIRTYQGTPFLVGEHIERLTWSARKIKFTTSVAPEVIRGAVDRVAEANGYPESLIRIVLTRGAGKPGEPSGRSTLIVLCDELKGYPAEYYDRGVATVSVIDNASELSMVNSLNQLPNALAVFEATAKHAFEAVFVTKKGFVTQGAASHVFVVLDGILITPPLERVVPGITREIVKSLAERDGITVKDDAVIAEELGDAEEAFLTSQLMELMPVATFDGGTIGAGAPGPVTHRLSQVYRRFIREKL